MIRRPVVMLLAVLLALTLMGTWLLRNEAHAQAVTPSADQLDMFRNLSSEQQQNILRSIGGALGGNQGGGLGGLSGGSLGLGQRNQDRDNQLDTLLQGRMRNEETEEPEPLIPKLRPDDWVIVEIDFHLPPRPQPTIPLGVQAIGGGGVPGGQPPGGQQAAAAGATIPTQVPVIPGATGGSVQSSGSQPPADMSDEEAQRLKELIRLIRARNPYKLSHDGVLYLPGFQGIPLAGLIEDLATLRLKVEPALTGLDVRVTRLPLEKTGAEGLKAFGYDLFMHPASTFAPVTNVPVPADYVLGAGDEIQVQLYGTQNRNLFLQVGRDGRINFPELGPINVAGQRFTSIKEQIEARVPREMVGTRASVAMGDTRSIRVFVLGETNRPGSYTISGLGTITSALYASGGVKSIGSLRNIQLKRQGAVVHNLDLYDMLIRGDTTDDTKLLPGDVIFVPPVGPTVSVDGQVHRPAIYELKGETTVAELVALAGGLLPEADTSNAMLTRIDPNQHRIVLPVEIAGRNGKTEAIHNGDVLRVMRLRPTLDAGITVKGQVFTPGAFAYRNGIRLTDVIHSVDELQPNADLHYLLIRREYPPDRHIGVLSADLSKALAAPGSKADLQLMPRDQITVFDLASGRDRVIKPLMDELRLQSNLAEPTPLVKVDGRIKVPGSYPLEPGMRVSDLIRAGGSLQDSAYGNTAELMRMDVTSGEIRRTELIEIDLAKALRGDPGADITLAPFDLLTIKELPQWSGQETVLLQGEVRFPGRYAVKRGETLQSVIRRAGGLTDFAFPAGAVFTREELRKREQTEMDDLAERMQHDLTILALQAVATNSGGNGAGTISVGQSLLSQLKATKAVGRLVIDLPRSMNAKPGSEADIVLREGDRLIVPKFQQEVTVIGEVQNATSHLYRSGTTRDDYVAQSGGTTRRADKSRIYVVRANGSVVAHESNRWFSRSDEPMHPGDTVVVPLDAEKMPALPFWQAVTGIFYNVAIAAAAVHSFQN
ncbi:MAG: SLBB domain-containing protein [Proteobacteria bacterium]|nr:SLBB domain-containing protein [Pseudomonadota bacterium]